MGRIVVSEWMSLDGVFEAESMDQWWNPFHSEDRAKAVQEAIADCDTMLYGRKTYEMLAGYWSTMKNNEMGVAAKLNSVPKYVVSTTLKRPAWENSTLIPGRSQEDVIAEIARLRARRDSRILVNGSATLVEALLKAGLVDELQFLIQPFIMGKGRRFFGEGMHAGLELTFTRSLDKGVTLLRYKPTSSPA